MAPLRASVSCTNLPAYCLATCPAPEESSLMARSKRICFQSAFEGSDDACEEEGSEEFIFHQHGKKRRLTVEQVKSLELNFELENKLDPERKIQIANELGLQPRQVAVWFQNRRARWKTKKLEKDYDALKMNYFSLKEKYDVLLKEKQNIEAEMLCLKKRLHLANSQTEGTEEDMEPNSDQIPTLEWQQSEKQSHHVKQQQDVINENYTVLAATEKKGSSLSDMDASEIPNTSNPGCLENKVSRIMENAAATRLLISNLTSYPEIKSLPTLFSESLLKKVQAASVKLEPEDAHGENACQNLFFEADQEADVVLWDWDFNNFDLNI